MIRAVLDANTLVASAPAIDGILFDLFHRWQANQLKLITSDFILGEIAHAWANPYWRARYPSEMTERAMASFQELAEIIPLTDVTHGAAPHAQDDFVLATAANGAADYLVTGDRQLQRLSNHRGVKIVSPRQFVAILDQR